MAVSETRPTLAVTPPRIATVSPGITKPTNRASSANTSNPTSRYTHTTGKPVTLSSNPLIARTRLSPSRYPSPAALARHHYTRWSRPCIRPDATRAGPLTDPVHARTHRFTVAR